MDPLPPARVDPKYRVPFEATDTPYSCAGEFTLSTGCDSLQPLERVTIQIFKSCSLESRKGRSEMKNSFDPSGAMAGEKSRYCPEKAATCGVVQMPLSE